MFIVSEILYLHFFCNYLAFLTEKKNRKHFTIFSFKGIWYSRSSPPMYLIVISQCPQTALTIGYSFLPLSPLNATPKYWPSTTKLIVPSSISRTTRNLSGTMKVSSGFSRAGYVIPGQFFESWYNLLRPVNQRYFNINTSNLFKHKT